MARRCLVFALGWTVAAAAQVAPDAVPRSPVAGQVVRHDRSPWPGAEVHLLARPLPWDETVGEADHVVVRANQRGRFRAALRRDRPYTAWARDARPTAGGWRVTVPAEGVRGGTAIELTGEVLSRPVQDVRLYGYSRWGELSAQLVSDTDNVHVVPLDLAADGTAPIPPMPGRRARIEVYDGVGRPVVATPLVGLEPTAGVHLGVPGVTRVWVGRSRELPAGFVDIAFEVRQRSLVLGATDAEGLAELRVSPMLDLIRHGHVIDRNGARGPLRGPRRFEARKHPGVKLIGRTGRGVRRVRHLRHDADTPAANLTLLITATDQLTVARTGADGRFEIPPIPGRRAVDVLLDDAVLARHPVWRELDVAPRAVGVFVTDFNARGRAAAENATIDNLARLDQLLPIRIEAVRADGLPAIGAALSLDRRVEAPTPRYSSRPAVAGFRLDHRGRITVVVRRGAHYGLAVDTGDEVALCDVLVPMTNGDDAAVKLETRSRWRVPVRLVDTDGRPVAGEVRWSRARERTPDPEPEQRLTGVTVHGGLTAEPWRDGASSGQVTAHDGNAVLAVPPTVANYQLLVVAGTEETRIVVPVEGPRTDTVEVVVR